MISSLLFQLVILFIAQVSGAVINVCDLPRDRRQQLNVSCNFNTKDGCTALYTSAPGNSWKYETKEVGNQWNGRITGDHNTGGSGGYYLFNALNFFARQDKNQLLTPLLPYNNICLRFWYNLPSTESNIKVLANNHSLFSRDLSKTQRWEQKNISISLQTDTPIQIAFESHKTHTSSYVGIDDVVIEIDLSATTSTISTTTILTTLITSQRNAPSITNSTKTANHTSTSSTVTTSTLTKLTNPTTISKLSTTATTLVTTQSAKTKTMAMNTKSATTATQNISTPTASVTPTKTSTTITSATTKSVRTTETSMKTSTTSDTTPPISIRRTSPITALSTTLTTTATTTRFESSTLTTAGPFTKPSTTGTATTIPILTSTLANTKRAKPTTTPTKIPPSVTRTIPKLTTMPTISNTLINTHSMPTTPTIISTNIIAPATILRTFEPASTFQDTHISIFILLSTTNSFSKKNN